MEQEVLHGEDIYENIFNSLLDANHEILVAVAWFTDEQLLNVLEKKSADGVKVRIKISNHEMNKLDFGSLKRNGGEVKVISGKGRGMLHDKYCVIDNKLAFHGSYNWTVNARKNNSESVIKTTHEETIKSLVKNFDTTSKGLLDFMKKKGVKIKLPATTEHTRIEPLSKIESSKEHSELDAIFDNIISSEAQNTNDKDIRDKGYNYCKEVSGNSEAIYRAMDSLYFLFMEDNSSNKDLKERLKEKITLKASDLKQQIITKYSNRISTESLNHIAKENDLKEKIGVAKHELDKEEEKLKQNEKSIEICETNINDLKNEKEEVRLDFVKQPINWLKLVPVLFIGLVLLAYSVLFYSSASYIMLYSAKDAEIAVMQGMVETLAPDVFEGQAFEKAYEKGLGSLFMILMFPFILIGLAFFSHNNESDKALQYELDDSKLIKKYLNKITNLKFYFIVLLVDAIIAFRVTQSINEINELMARPTIDNILEDLNFWLVFCLGALALVLLGMCISEFYKLFEGRTSELADKKLKLQKQSLKNKIALKIEELQSIKQKSDAIELQILEKKSAFELLNSKLHFLPHENQKSTDAINELKENELAVIDKKSDLYKNDIDNDNVKITISTLNHRVSVYMEGWSERLYDYFSNEIAEDLHTKATDVANEWMNNKFTKKSDSKLILAE